MRRALAGIIAVALASSTARADDPAPSADDRSEADKLFDEGRALLAAKQTDAACAKFEDSIGKDPGAVGTLLNLALCNERRGKLATALAFFQRAFDRAGDADAPVQRHLAETEIARIAADVPVAAIAWSAPALPGEKLFVDDVAVPLDRKEMPLDPGPHAVLLTAPGRVPYTGSLAARAGERTRLVLPALALPATGPDARWRRPWGHRLVAGGSASLALALGSALYADRRYRAQFVVPPGKTSAPCMPDGVCTVAGKSAVDRARLFGDVATVASLVGIAAAASGAYLWATAPSARVGIAPVLDARTAGIALVGAF